MQLNYLNKPFFENGCIEKISAILEDQNILNPLICTDPGITNAGMTDQLVGLLSTKIKHSVYDKIIGARKTNLPNVDNPFR